MVYTALFSYDIDTADQPPTMPRPSGTEVTNNLSSTASATPNIALPLAQSQPPSEPEDSLDVDETLETESSPDVPTLLSSNEPTTLRRRTVRSTTVR